MQTPPNGGGTFDAVVADNDTRTFVAGLLLGIFGTAIVATAQAIFAHRVLRIGAALEERLRSASAERWWNSSSTPTSEGDVGMSHGGYGGGDPFGSSPFPGDPFSAGPLSVPPPGHAPHPAPPRSTGPETNTLATLSVVFAFVFAPAGAVLGHLGLAQIGRTGQRGRERALVGVTLSYAFIVVAVVAVAVWTVTGGNPTAPATVASPTTSATATTAPTTTTPPAPPPPPPPPTVDGAALPGLLLSLDEMKALTGDSGLTIASTKPGEQALGVDSGFGRRDVPPGVTPMSTCRRPMNRRTTRWTASAHSWLGRRRPIRARTTDSSTNPCNKTRQRCSRSFRPWPASTTPPPRSGR